MKTLLIKFVKVAGFSFLIALVTLLIWANWEAPSLSEKLNLKPINLVVFNLDRDINQADSLTISKRVSATKGVTACTVNPKSKAVSVTYYDDVVNESKLSQVIEEQDIATTKVNFAAMEGPKCPIPAEYIDGLTILKRRLSFR